jgi:hypothetical protein
LPQLDERNDNDRAELVFETRVKERQSLSYKIPLSPSLPKGEELLPFIKGEREGFNAGDGVEQQQNL